MNDRRSSVDGFIPRQAGSQLGDRHRETRQSVAKPARRVQLSSEQDLLRENLSSSKTSSAIGRSDIDESLSNIGAEEPSKKLSRRQRRREDKRSKKPKSKVKRIIKWVLLLLLLLSLVFVGIVAYKAIHNSGKIFKGNILDVLTQKSVPLQQDSNGRTNVLILGTSEDDPGHEAGNLTDSMMIMSIDQTNKNAYLISIPRDLWVQYGEACAAGYSGKINVYYSCVGGDPDDTDVNADRKALTKTASFVGDIFGLKIQYGVNVNYTVFRDVVNAIGGNITVNIQSRDAAGVMDSNFDWKCGANYSTRLKNCPPNGHYIQYPNGEVTLDAEHALYLAQARGDSAPTYGFEQSNFDREKNQQMILKAVRTKAMSAGLFTNPTEISKILDSLGTNLRTTFEADEVKTLTSLASNIKDGDIKSVSLIDADPSVVTTGNVNGQSAVQPSAGLYDYTDIRALVAKSLSSNPVIREAANVVVLNGSGVTGMAQTEATKLETAGYTITTVDTADVDTYKGYTVYQIGTGDSGTKAALAKLYNVKVKTTTPPFTVAADTNFVVVVGSAVTTQSSSNK